MKKRSILLMIFLTFITLGIYTLVWFERSRNELNSTGLTNIRSALWLLAPVLGILWLLSYFTEAEKVLRANGKENRYDPYVYFVAVVILPFLLQLAPVILQAEYNESKFAYGSVKSLKDYLLSKEFALLLTGAGVVVLLSTIVYWNNNIYMTTERRFWSAINTSMATPSALRTLTEKDDNSEVIQKYRFFYSPERVFQYTVSYSDDRAGRTTNVETEGIVYYPQDQFLRYNSFDSQKDGEDSGGIDELLGVWASQESQDPQQDKQNYQGELVTLAIFGNFDARFRNEILTELKQSEAYGDVTVAEEAEDENGEAVLNYALTVKLKPYVAALNKAFERAGFEDYPQLDPENYEDDATVPSTFSILKKDSTIATISFGSRIEKYSSYGVVTPPVRPEATLTVEELQVQVQEVVQTLQ